ncbi:MAG: hypothetical protein AVDCRST_MAG42-1688 [uncultured Chthoniobacterales bacterium]|uniref:Uncharacterized protein n=1 Tax=uncultured Chthoniobacterales bacterium TaxID=1836801 RepID=A0A6J4I583_9BACT|nr:MAG: hypothetical protein AVDCRST_MAG42-1688 [uncultured Chthoniobacterales bacterium]
MRGRDLRSAGSVRFAISSGFPDAGSYDRAAEAQQVSARV